MLHRLKSFIAFFVKSEHLEIQSCFDKQKALERILTLNEGGEVRATITKRSKIMVVGTQHGGRSNVLHFFEGSLEDNNGRGVLRGELGLDPGIRIFLGFFCVFIFVFCPLSIWFGSVKSHGSYYIGPLVLLGLLAFAYLNGRDDDAKIKENLTRALHQAEGVTYG